MKLQIYVLLASSALLALGPAANSTPCDKITCSKGPYSITLQPEGCGQKAAVVIRKNGTNLTPPRKVRPLVTPGLVPGLEVKGPINYVGSDNFELRIGNPKGTSDGNILLYDVPRGEKITEGGMSCT